MAINVLGYVGPGMMDGPICRHLAAGRASVGLERVVAFGLDEKLTDRLARHGVVKKTSIAALAGTADLVLLNLPSAAELGRLVRRHDGLLDSARAGQMVVDLGTSPVALTRQLAMAFASKGVVFMDSPITRLRKAPKRSALSTFVGGETMHVQTILPILRCFSATVVHCGPLGCGQVVKQMDDMVLFQTVTALAEALATARAAGVDGAVLLAALAEGTAGSVALRRHGVGTLLRADPAEAIVSIADAERGLSHAVTLAESLGLDLAAARSTLALFTKAIEAGTDDAGFSSIVKSLHPGERD